MEGAGIIEDQIMDKDSLLDFITKFGEGGIITTKPWEVWFEVMNDIGQLHQTQSTSNEIYKLSSTGLEESGEEVGVRVVVKISNLGENQNHNTQCSLCYRIGIVDLLAHCVRPTKL